MNNPFQEQLLKAGLVSKQQVNRVNQEKLKKKKQQRGNKQASIDENRVKAQQAAHRKAEIDRELNRKKQQQAQKKAISIEIDQLIKDNAIKRDASCDLAYNFEHYNKVKRLYVNEDLKRQLVQGKLGIARITGNYELVPRSVADKIRQRNEKRIIVFQADQPQENGDDPYAEFQVPDDLMW